MRITSLVLISLLATPAFTQQHVPTLEVCRAEVSLWQTQLKEKHSLPYGELEKRVQELIDCRSVDTASEYRFDYILVQLAYENERRFRLESFIERHALIQGFLDEDALKKKEN